MKFIIVFVALFAFAMANDPRTAETLHYESNVHPVHYDYNVQTSDGKSVQESGLIENIGKDDEALSVEGSYSYVGDDGVTYKVNYIADRYGFQPRGAHIKVP